MEVKKELIDLFNKYHRALGINKTEEAVQLTLAHVLVEAGEKLTRLVEILEKYGSPPEG